MPTNGHSDVGQEIAGHTRADRADAEPDAQHHVERREREHALAAVEPRLDGAHARRQRVRRARSERRGAEPRDPQRRREAEHRDHGTDVRDAEASARQQVAMRHALEDEQAAGRADAEQRDQHTEPGVGHVQDVVHEHDAEREQRAETERDRERRRHHRTHQRDPERVEEAARPTRRRPWLCVVPSWVSFEMQKNETRNVSASMKKTSAYGR